MTVEAENKTTCFIAALPEGSVSRRWPYSNNPWRKHETGTTSVGGLLPVEVAASWQWRVEVRFSHFEGYSPSRHRSFLPSNFLCPGVRALCLIVE